MAAKPLRLARWLLVTGPGGLGVGAVLLHLDSAGFHLCARLLGLCGGAARPALCAGVLSVPRSSPPALPLRAPDRDQPLDLRRLSLPAPHLPSLLLRRLL